MPVALFDRTFDDWNAVRKAAVRADAERFYPGDHADRDALIAAAHAAATPHRLAGPVVGGVSLEPFDAAEGLRLAGGIPGEPLPPKRMIRIRIAVDGDATVLAVKPPTLAAPRTGWPRGRIGDGEVVVEVKDPTSGVDLRAAVDGAVEAIKRAAAALARDVVLFSQPVGECLEYFEQRQAAAREAKKADEAAARRLFQLGYRIYTPPAAEPDAA